MNGFRALTLGLQLVGILNVYESLCEFRELKDDPGIRGKCNTLAKWIIKFPKWKLVDSRVSAYVRLFICKTNWRVKATPVSLCD